MTTNSHALASEMPYSTSYRMIGLASFGQLQRFPQTPISICRNTNFILGTRGKLHALHIISRRADSQDSIKEVGHIPTTPQEEPSLSSWYVRGTLNLLRHVQWIPRLPESKESRISLQWLECRLVFLLTT